MKYSKKVWVPGLVIVLVIIAVAGFIFINSIKQPDRVLADDARQIQSNVAAESGNMTNAPDMDGIETDAMLKDINEKGALHGLDAITEEASEVTSNTSENKEDKTVNSDNIDELVKSLGINNDSKSNIDEIKVTKVELEPKKSSVTPVEIEKGMDLKPGKETLLNHGDSKVLVEKGADIDRVPVAEKMNIIKMYKSPYFSVSYPAGDWDYAVGKSMNLPSFVDIPKKTAVATIEFFNKKNGNSIFLHISYSGGADLNKMTASETTNYLRYIYNDNRIEKVPVEYINNMRFAVLKFVPRNNKQFLVKQYLTSKNNYLYCITFVEKQSSEIGKKMIDEVLGSMLVK